MRLHGHANEVLGELGFGKGQIDELQVAKLI